jgi:hypothetical protein
MADHPQFRSSQDNKEKKCWKMHCLNACRCKFVKVKGKKEEEEVKRWSRLPRRDRHLSTLREKWRCKSDKEEEEFGRLVPAVLE